MSEFFCDYPYRFSYLYPSHHYAVFGVHSILAFWPQFWFWVKLSRETVFQGRFEGVLFNNSFLHSLNLAFRTIGQTLSFCPIKSSPLGNAPSRLLTRACLEQHVAHGIQLVAIGTLTGLARSRASSRCPRSPSSHHWSVMSGCLSDSLPYDTLQF